jgi:Holliday junction resolvase
MRSKSLLKNRPQFQNQKSISKNLENCKIARTRRQRGYQWEDTLVKRFNKMEQWKAFRLGSPSVALPDLLCVNNHESKIFTIEAKSGTSTSLTVPFDQILRCMNWTDNFTIYNVRNVIFAFKFLSKKRIGKGEYEKRELREYYKIWNNKIKPINIVCKYDGDVYGLEDGKKVKTDLKDYEMPFKSKHQKFSIMN